MHGCRRKVGSAVPRSRESPGSGDDLSPAWRQVWVRREGSHGHQGTCPRRKGDTVTSPASGASGADALPDYAPVPRSALGPVLNDQGYHVGRVERNLYWVTDGTYQAAFLTTPDGVVLFDAPPTIGHNLQRAIDEIAAAADDRAAVFERDGNSRRLSGNRRKGDYSLARHREIQFSPRARAAASRDRASRSPAPSAPRSTGYGFADPNLT